MKKYSSKINLGQIKQFASNESIIWELNAGFFGKKTYTLKPKEDGTYDIFIGVFHKDEDKFKDIKIGQTFPVKNREGEIVEGLTQTTLALTSSYDAELKKEVYDDTNALYITTHLLKEPKVISDKVSQIGWVDGSFGITQAEETSEGVVAMATETEEPASKEIPF